MSIIYSSNECWSIEKVNLDDNIYYYAFTCPCLFKIQFTREVFDSAILFERLMKFDSYIYPRTSLWAIYRTDIYYHAILLSEEVNTKDKTKLKKYIEVLNSKDKEYGEHGEHGVYSSENNYKSVYLKHVHNFSRLYDGTTNKPLPRSLQPLLMCYFGDTNSANSKCIYLASIYNTLVQETILNNDKLLEPSYLKNMKITYIQPVIPQIVVENYIKYFYLFTLLSSIFIFYKLKTLKTSKQNYIYLILGFIVTIFALYYIFKFIVIKHLVNKGYDSLVKYHNEYHMRCHMSCNNMFQLRNQKPNKLKYYEDIPENELHYKNFETNEYRNHNFEMIDDSIHKSRNDCHFNCGNGAIVLINHIYNNIPFKHLESDYTMLLDSINHMYMMMGNHGEIDKQKYYNLITRYFTFTFV